MDWVPLHPELSINSSININMGSMCNVVMY